jgi:hypothetical protein
MRSRGHGVTVASGIMHNLQHDKSLKSWLDLMFPPSLKLVDLARGVFFHPQIAGAMRSGGDQFTSSDDAGWKYLLEPDSFDERAVQNPIAFTFGRLTETLESEESLSVIAMARRSAWDFLAGSSRPIKT